MMPSWACFLFFQQRACAQQQHIVLSPHVPWLVRWRRILESVDTRQCPLVFTVWIVLLMVISILQVRIVHNDVSLMIRRKSFMERSGSAMPMETPCQSCSVPIWKGSLLIPWLKDDKGQIGTFCVVGHQTNASIVAHDGASWCTAKRCAKTRQSRHLVGHQLTLLLWDVLG